MQWRKNERRHQKRALLLSLKLRSNGARPAEVKSNWRYVGAKVRAENEKGPNKAPFDVNAPGLASFCLETQNST